MSTPEPTTTTHWGILAPGRIAEKFAEGLRGTDTGKLYAVGSRSEERAKKFAERFRAEVSYGSYEELVSDPNVHAIYVANPHNYHKEAALLCLEHGKPVLCEKPIAVNAHDAKEMVDASHAHDVFFMEAMWTRFMPAMQQARAWIDAGRIGEVRRVDAHFGFRSGWDPEARLLNPNLAGGALLDVGIYVVSFAYWMTRLDPVAITGQAHVGETGVDEQSAALLRYNDGAIATLSCAVRTATNNRAAVFGTEGWIEFDAPFFVSTKATLHVGDETIVFEQPFAQNGYEYEAIEVARCLAAGKKESLILPRDESVRIMKTLDELRRQWNLVYPFEEQR
ncbi:MAG: Gfo/Idh/MocA family protein [Spirochaetales bacterium]